MAISWRPVAGRIFAGIGNLILEKPARVGLLTGPKTLIYVHPPDVSLAADNLAKIRTGLMGPNEPVLTMQESEAATFGGFSSLLQLLAKPGQPASDRFILTGSGAKSCLHQAFSLIIKETLKHSLRPIEFYFPLDSIHEYYEDGEESAKRVLFYLKSYQSEARRLGFSSATWLDDTLLNRRRIENPLVRIRLYSTTDKLLQILSY